MILGIIGRSAGSQAVFAKLRIPVILTVPVCFGEVSADADAFLTESVEHGFYDIRMLVLVEGAVLSGNFVISVGGIPETETIVVLRGQKKIAETAVLSHLCPLLRLETHGVEGFVQTEILFLESLSVVGPVNLVAGPVSILVA